MLVFNYINNQIFTRNTSPLQPGNKIVTNAELENVEIEERNVHSLSFYHIDTKTLVWSQDHLDPVYQVQEEHNRFMIIDLKITPFHVLYVALFDDRGITRKNKALFYNRYRLESAVKNGPDKFLDPPVTMLDVHQFNTFPTIFMRILGNKWFVLVYESATPSFELYVLSSSAMFVKTNVVAYEETAVVNAALGEKINDYQMCMDYDGGKIFGGAQYLFDGNHFYEITLVEDTIPEIL
jgi:hypothetical protein